jgi:hypothetical protein
MAIRDAPRSPSESIMAAARRSDARQQSRPRARARVGGRCVFAATLLSLLAAMSALAESRNPLQVAGLNPGGLPVGGGQVAATPPAPANSEGAGAGQPRGAPTTFGDEEVTAAGVPFGGKLKFINVPPGTLFIRPNAEVVPLRFGRNVLD